MSNSTPKTSASCEKTVVLIEDQTLFRKMLARSLRTLPGLRIVGEAMDGETGLAVCREHRPDLVLLDLDLPRMSGVEVAQFLRAEMPATRVLVLSGSDDSMRLRSALRAGIAGLVDKDQAFEVLMAALESILGGGSYFTGMAARELRLMPTESDSPLEGLTAREMDVLRLVARGVTNKEAAGLLNISARTVEVHRLHLMKKLRVQNAAELAALAARSGIKL